MTAPTYGALIEDLAKHLAAAKIGQWATNGIYKTYTPPAIYLGTIPDEATYGIALNVYADDRHRDDTSPVLYVQIRIRGDKNPRTAAQIADRIFTHLHDQSDYRLDNGTRVLLSRRHLRTAEELDISTGRWTRADSYTFTLNP